MGRERVPTVKVIWQGRDVSESVLSVTVEDDDRLADKAELIYESRTACAAFAEGQELSIALGWEGEAAKLFVGVIVRLKVEATPEGTERATVVALDLSTRMHREAKTFQYTGGTVSQVIETIVVAYGLEVGRIECDPDLELTPRTPLRQTNQTDLVFLQYLARLYLARAFVEVNDDRPQFYFVPERTILAAPVAGRMKYCGGTGDLRSFEYRRAAVEAPAAASATAVDEKSAKPATAAAEEPVAIEPVTVDDSLLDGLAKRDPAAGEAYTAAVETAGKAPETPDAQVRKAAVVGTPSDPERARLAARRETTAPRGMTGSGVAIGTVHLRAKSLVEVAGIAPWAEGAWYVKRAKHVYTRNTYETHFEATR